MQNKRSKRTLDKSFLKEPISKNRIESMIILKSEKFIRLLQDRETKLYFVFNGRLNQSFYSKSYQAAEKHYNHLVSIS